MALCAVPLASADPASSPLAVWLLDWSGAGKGLCVHVGCDAGQLTRELSRHGQFFVEGLEPEPARARAARRELSAVYGTVTVRACSLEKLPYAENMVNLIIVDNIARCDKALHDVARVLRPGGIAIVGQSGAASDKNGEVTRPQFEDTLRKAGLVEFEIREQQGLWARFEKPWPSELDQWTHPRYDATGNAVCADTVSSPPRRIRWIAGPMRAPGYQISAGGRNLYAGLIARDAFNGLQLWSRAIEPAPLGGADPVAAKQLLFVVHQGKLQAWDAKSGETVWVYEAAGTPSEILHHDGMLVTLDNASIRALDVSTGKLLWRRSASIPGCVSVSETAVFFVRGNPRRGEKCEVLRLDRVTGSEVWRQGKARFRGDSENYEWLARATKSCYHDGLLAFETSTYTDFAAGNEIHVLSADDGSYLAGRSSEPGGHYGQARTLFVDGLLWTRDGRNTEGMDPRTGEIKRRYPVGTGHCFPPVATPRYMIAGEMHFTDLATGAVDANRISKGTCSRATGFVPANGLVYVAQGKLIVARPDAHEIVAMNAHDGTVLWRLVADGRVDTPPTVWRGLCLFGTRNGWVYCLQTDIGKVVWRLRVAADDEQITAFGQTESPWPVAGSVLVIDGLAYVAAGRQYLAEGGVRFFALDAASGEVRWSKSVTDLPGHDYYAAAGLEFDNYDLMVREGNSVAMSRWLFDRETGTSSTVPLSGFAHYATGDSGVMAPRGHWSYGPRMGRAEDRIRRRPLVVFRDNILIGSTDDRCGLFRRDFTAEQCADFDREWYSYRKVARSPTDGGESSRTERFLQNTHWNNPAAASSPIDAIILAGDKVYCATETGKLAVFSMRKGQRVATQDLAPVIWDGMAAAEGHLYVSSTAGEVMCLGAATASN